MIIVPSLFIKINTAFAIHAAENTIYNGFGMAAFLIAAINITIPNRIPQIPKINEIVFSLRYLIQIPV